MLRTEELTVVNKYLVQLWRATC